MSAVNTPVNSVSSALKAKSVKAEDIQKMAFAIDELTVQMSAMKAELERITAQLAVAAEPKKRGRKPKAAAEPAAEEAAAPKKRGRKPKMIAVADAAPAAPEASDAEAAPKKRGRKPKAAAEPAAPAAVNGEPAAEAMEQA